MTINTVDKMNLDEYTAAKDKESKLTLDTKVADLLEDAPVTTTTLNHVAQQSRVNSNYEAMNAISGKISYLDSSEEQAQSRYQTALAQLKANMNLIGGDKAEKLIADAEKAEENETNIIFSILDTLAKPMYAMEGAVTGLFARNDDNFEGMNFAERVLSGISDGWTGAEDSEGNRIITDAGVVASIFTGSSDISDWSMAERLVVGMSTMIIFGHYDPVMRGFSTLKGTGTVKGWWRSMQEGTMLPKMFRKRRFNTAEADQSITAYMEQEGKILNDAFDEFVKSGSSAYEIYNGTTGKTFNSKEFTESMKKMMERHRNDSSINRDVIQAYNKFLRDAVINTYHEAVATADFDVLEDIGIFQVIKEKSGKNLSNEEALYHLKDIMASDGNKKELLTAIYMEMSSRLHKSILESHGFKLSMNEVFKDIVTGSGKYTTLTKLQVNELKSKILQSGLLSKDEILASLKANKADIVGGLDELGAINKKIELIKNIERNFLSLAREFNIEGAMDAVEGEYESIETLIEMFEKIGISGDNLIDSKFKSIQDVNKLLQKLSTKTGNQEMVTKINEMLEEYRGLSVKEFEDLILNLDAKGNKRDKMIEELTAQKKELEETVGKKGTLDKANKKYEEMISLLEGNINYSETENELERAIDAFTEAEEMEASHAKLYDKLEAKVKDMETELANLQTEAAGMGAQGKLYTQGNTIYKNYKENLKQLKHYQTIKKQGHVTKFPYTEQLHQKINGFTLDNKVLNTADNTGTAMGALKDIPKATATTYFETLRARNPEVYKTFEEMGLIKANNKRYANRINESKIEEISKKTTRSPFEQDILKAKAYAEKSLEELERLASNYNTYEKGLTEEFVDEEIKSLVTKVKKNKKDLTKVYNKYEEVIAKEGGDDIKNIVSQIKAQKHLLEEKKVLLGETQTNKDRRTADKTDLANQIKRLTSKVASESQSLEGISANTLNESAYSYKGIKVLEPIISKYLNVTQTTKYLTDTENPLARMGLYQISANTGEKEGLEWLNQLIDVYSGKEAINANRNFDWQNTPLVNSRMIDGLNEYINIGTSGVKFTSPKLQEISADLKQFTTSIFSKIIRKSFAPLVEGGDELSDELITAITKQNNAITGEIQDELVQYQRKVLNPQIESKQKVSALDSGLTGSDDMKVKRLSKQGQEALANGSYRGSVDDINLAVGNDYAMGTKTSYDKYDITKQLFLDDPFASASQIYEDSQLIGNYGATLVAAAQNGAFFTGATAPVKLLQEGRLVRTQAGDFKLAVLKFMKIEAENNLNIRKKKMITESEKLSQLGIEAQSAESIEAQAEQQLKDTMSRASNYIDGFIKKHFGDILDVASEEGEPFIYIPKELHNILMPKVTNLSSNVNQALQWYDKGMNWWKKLTLLTPGFNFKNIIGNFASMYTVDPGGLSIDALSRGKELYDSIPAMNSKIKEIAARGISENPALANGDDIRKYIIEEFRNNADKYTDFNFPKHNIKPVDYFLLVEEAERVRVIDKTIDDIIGMDKVVGNPSVATTPRDISEALRATHAVDALGKTDPVLAQMLTGIGYDPNKPKNVFNSLQNLNLSMSHDMTSGGKMFQLVNNKKYEQQWFNKFTESKGHEKLSLSEFEDKLNSLSYEEKTNWKKFKEDMYRKEFGYKDSYTMIQDMFFDPGALTATERGIMSRLVPFWGFFKKSLELSFSRINNLDFRGLYGIERGVRHVMDLQGIHSSDMSEFARNEQYIPIKIGENKIVNIKWGNPTQTLNNLLVRDKNILAELFGNANPIIKFMVSEVANREDLFFGGKYDSLFDEAVGTLAPGSVRNLQRQIKTYNTTPEDMDHEKSILTKVAPSIFSDQVISDNNAAAFNAAALVLEKGLNELQYDKGFQISRDTLFPELPEYQDFILDLY